MISCGTNPEPAPVLTSTASGPEGHHPVFSTLPTDEEMEEMSLHLDECWQEFADMEKHEDTAGDEIYEDSKEQYNLDLQIYESLTIRIHIAETRLAAELEARQAASLRPARP